MTPYNSRWLGGFVLALMLGPSGVQAQTTFLIPPKMDDVIGCRSERCRALHGMWTRGRQKADTQTLPAVELSGAYSRLTDARASLNTTTDRPPMNGWYLEVAGNRSRRLSLVAAIDAAHGSYEGRTAWGYANTWSDLGVLGGVRWTGRWNRIVIPYAQMLGGSFRTTQTYTSHWSGGRYSTTTSSIVLQPGVGLNLMFSERFGLRFAADIKTLPNFDWVDEAAGNSMTRVVVGSVVTFGQR